MYLKYSSVLCIFIEVPAPILVAFLCFFLSVYNTNMVRITEDTVRKVGVHRRPPLLTQALKVTVTAEVRALQIRMLKPSPRGPPDGTVFAARLCN